MPLVNALAKPEPPVLPKDSSYNEILRYLKDRASKDRYTSCSQVCSVGVIWPGAPNSYSYTYTPGYACHAVVNNWVGREYKALISSFWFSEDRPIEVEAYKAYCDFLLGDESPYVSLWKDKDIKRTIVYKSDEADVPWAFVLEGDIAGMSTQVCINLCIAARQAYEHPHVVKSWYQFVKKGFTHREAFFLMSYMWWDEKRKTVYKATPAGHIHIDYYWTKIDHKAMLSGTPVFNKAQVFKGGGRYSPCNAIWYGGKDNGYSCNPAFVCGHPWVEKVIVKAKAVGGDLPAALKYTGVFPKAHQDHLRNLYAQGSAAKDVLPTNTLDVALEMRKELYE